MKIEKRTTFTCLILVLIIFSMSIQNNDKNSDDLTRQSLNIRPSDLRSAGFWNNFTFIHITDLNWTTASSYDWCAGSGTWGDPYVIENMLINANSSPIGAGIFIENSVNVYFTIRNITIYGGTNGIRLENTNSGTFVDNVLSNNVENGIYMINCVNNTILRNKLINNDMYGLYMSSNCLNNKIIGNTAKNDGASLQEAGVFMQNFCDDNELIGNSIYDNNVYGINIEGSCEGNLICNNTLKNVAANQQDDGIRLYNDCHQNNLSLNTIENLNTYGIIILTSDQNLVANNQIIDVSTGIYILNDLQSEITSNIISDCSIGISISGCSDGDIIGNFINETTNYAIRIYTNSDDNEFSDNIIKDNIGIGVELLEPLNDNNMFYRNSFISNGVHAYDNGMATFWNNTMIGNYWDNYTGLDLDNDHIGDTPFNIHGASNANDSLPMVNNGTPSITINTPTSNEYGDTAPEFNIFVDDPFIYSMWYNINNSGKNYYFTKNGTINLNAWSALSDGNLTITFYARNYAWNKGSTSIDLIKKTSQGPEDPVDPVNPGNGSPPINIVLIVVISVIVIAVIAIAGILVRRLPKNR
ncbi:MAG: nitrous oxide reductase family maturation protein NosD, partial [Candidatus Hermodarchaeota archaeon]